MSLVADIRELVLDILNGSIPPGSTTVTMQTSLDDIDFDSLALTAIVARTELAFDLRFSSTDILSMMQAMLVCDLVDLIHDRALAQTAPPRSTTAS